jgi:hypothetical protein
VCYVCVKRMDFYDGLNNPFKPIRDRRDLETEHIILLTNLERLSQSDNAEPGSAKPFSELYPDFFEAKHYGTFRTYRAGAFKFLTKIRDAKDWEVKKQLLTRKSVAFLLRDKANVDVAKELELHLLGRSLSDHYHRVDEDGQEQSNVTSNGPSSAASIPPGILPSEDEEDYDMHRQTEGASSNTNSVDLTSQEICGSYLESSHVSDELRKEYEGTVRDILMKDILPGRIGHVKLTQQQLSILCRSERTPNDDAVKYTGRRMLGHISTRERLTHATVTRILHDFHKYEIQLNYNDLPKMAKTLLKITTEDLRQVRIREIFGPVTVGRGAQVTAKYLHVWIGKSLLLKAPGIIRKWQYVNTLRVVYALFPDFIPEELKEVIRPQAGEEYDKNILEDWGNLPSADPSVEKRQLVLEIHGHLDGVKWFENSTQPKGVPILGRLVAIRDEVTGECVKTTTLAPFVIGVMQPFKTPVNTKDFVMDFVYELKRLLDKDMSGLSFKVSIVRL